MYRKTRRTMGATATGALLALAAVVATESPIAGQPAILADGVVESTAGGFKFPDGSIQETAAGAGSPCGTLDPSDEMIQVGDGCIDKYEASIWNAPVGGNQIVGTEPEDYCSPNGQDCEGIYARSVAGVEPAAHVTWFQAQQALANSGKRLPTNAEWQVAVAGTPDPPGVPGSEDCNTQSAAAEVTGERENCVSRWGAHDMIGNLHEWVADWVPYSTDNPGWGPFSDDFMSLAGASTTQQGPGALVRGGSFINFFGAGPLAVSADVPPNVAGSILGFRGAR